MRENEKEADRLAINILANANINPKAMSNFFRTLLKKNNEDGAIEWLRTHPLTKNRIIETEILSSKYKGKFVDDSFTYQFVSAKISMDNIDTRKFISGYKYKNEAYNTPSKVIDHYAYGLALTEEKYIKAINVFENLLSILNTKDKLNTVKNYISIALANAHIKNNDFKKSLTILENLNNIYPTNNSILYYLSNAYINTKDYRRVLDKLIPVVIENKDHRLIMKISEATYKLKQQSLGHEYRGDYLRIIGSFNSAIKFYKLALKYNMKGSTIDKRIHSKIKKIKELQKT